jgi:hypothetical protein
LPIEVSASRHDGYEAAGLRRRRIDAGSKALSLAAGNELMQKAHRLAEA